MTHIEQLAAFAAQASYSRLSGAAREALKARVLDALGCALGALDAQPPGAIAALAETLGGNPLCTLIGGGRTAPDRAALYNGALVRYLDFNDSFLAKGETCHPSDNLAAVLAAAEYAGASGEDVLAALAVAYQVQCRLSEVAPVRHRGFDHTTQGAYAAAAGVGRALGLDAARLAHAIAISGAANNALRVTRTGALSQWKGLAYPNTAAAALQAAFLAGAGITGPREVFEGKLGFMEVVSGPFELDWAREDLEAVLRTSIKRYNAEVHSQSVVEGVLELRLAEGVRPADVERIEIDTFQVAFDIIGGGSAGPRHRVRTKEEADHSLPYLVAVAMLDGELGPSQYRVERITAHDVQSFMSRVRIAPDDRLSARFPEAMPCRIRVALRDGTVWRLEKEDYWGYYTRPLPWERVVAKFHSLAAPFAGEELRQAMVEAVQTLEARTTRELTGLLGAVGIRGAARRDAASRDQDQGLRTKD